MCVISLSSIENQRLKIIRTRFFKMQWRLKNIQRAWTFFFSFLSIYDHARRGPHDGKMERHDTPFTSPGIKNVKNDKLYTFLLVFLFSFSISSEGYLTRKTCKWEIFVTLERVDFFSHYYCKIGQGLLNDRATEKKKCTLRIYEYLGILKDL